MWWRTLTLFHFFFRKPWKEDTANQLHLPKHLKKISQLQVVKKSPCPHWTVASFVTDWPDSPDMKPISFKFTQITLGGSTFFLCFSEKDSLYRGKQMCYTQTPTGRPDVGADDINPYKKNQKGNLREDLGEPHKCSKNLGNKIERKRWWVSVSVYLLINSQ